MLSLPDHRRRHHQNHQHHHEHHSSSQSRNTPYHHEQLFTIRMNNLPYGRFCFIQLCLQKASEASTPSSSILNQILRTRTVALLQSSQEIFSCNSWDAHSRWGLCLSSNSSDHRFPWFMSMSGYLASFARGPPRLLHQCLLHAALAVPGNAGGKNPFHIASSRTSLPCDYYLVDSLLTARNAGLGRGG